MLKPKIRYTLLTEAQNYADRDAYISDMALSSIWGDGAEIPQERLELIGKVYDWATAEINALLRTHKMTQRDFARYFGMPLRTVQAWCGGARQCPPYVLAMAAELLDKA